MPVGTMGWISGPLKGLVPGTPTKRVGDNPMKYNRKASEKFSTLRERTKTLLVLG